MESCDLSNHACHQVLGVCSLKCTNCLFCAASRPGTTNSNPVGLWHGGGTPNPNFGLQEGFTEEIIKIKISGMVQELAK